MNVEQIRQGTIGEGYGICDLSTSTRYFDYSDSGDSGNWNAPVLQMQTATLVKIARTTTDGLWTLTQTITNSPGPNPYAKVLMQLKNNSAIGKAAYLFRWVDVDPGNPAETDSDFNESLDSSFASAFGWVAVNETGSSGSNAPSFGLMFQGVGNPTPASVPYGRNGYSLIGAGPDPCNPAAAYQSPINLTDGTFEYLWFVELTKGQSVSVTGKYFSF